MVRDHSDSQTQATPEAKARIVVSADDPAMNQTEAAYAHLLDVRKTIGEVHSWGFEAMRFKLADKCYFTPDFFVIKPDGSIEFHEVKGTKAGKHGNQRDDARVKIKAAAVMFPWFRFFIFARVKGVWSTEEFKP